MAVKPVCLAGPFTIAANTADESDDLLQCDCQTRPESDPLSEREENLPSPDKASASDDEDDVPKGFVNASQYDPTPVSSTFPVQHRQ